MTSIWYTGTVFRGNQLGRTIGYPTINLDPTLLPSTQKPGVYASRVRTHGKEYLGALYIGPRLVLKEMTTVLEIYILDFDEDIYEQPVEFQVHTFIRGVENFPDFDHLQKRLALDVDVVQASFHTST